MSETISLQDMAWFARVAELEGFTAAASALGVPKQTLSRRVAELERALGVPLLHRTTRKVRLSAAGAAYAARCAELVRLAEDANRALTDARDEPAGTLRVTADPVFGEAFLTALLVEYASRWPEVRLDVALTRRRVDLVEEGFDVAFRVGALDDASSHGARLGPATVRLCASRRYVARHGAPRTADELGAHACLIVGSDRVTRWPVPGPRGPRSVTVTGKHVFTSFAMAHAAARAGLGVAVFPEFACAEDIRRGRLVPVLDGHAVDVGAVWLLHSSRRFLPARVRAFVDLARARFGARAPWVTSEGGAPARSTKERGPSTRGRRAPRGDTP